MTVFCRSGIITVPILAIFTKPLMLRREESLMLIKIKLKLKCLSHS
jgi:hypothetical protein